MNTESFKEYISLVGGGVGCGGYYTSVWVMLWYSWLSHYCDLVVWGFMSWRNTLSSPLQDLQLCGYPHIRVLH